MDTLSRLSHDADAEVSMAAIISLGLIGAGTNNACLAGMICDLSSYYYKEAGHLFCGNKKRGCLMSFSKGRNQWLLDSGASYHMTGKKSCLKILRAAKLHPEIQHPIENALSQFITLDEMGNIQTDDIQLSRVMYSSTLEPTEHLVSVGQLTDMGFVENGKFSINADSQYDHVIGYGDLDENLMSYHFVFMNETASLQDEDNEIEDMEITDENPIVAGPEYQCAEGANSSS